ncbi:hypothetical protein OVN18_00080 [Microcella daejeonensis]|uniref:Uncharacterized protein n=1 Tax=Microcella daejeonensis TaxID=2994971 RepID=A0A9E8MM03_9MICO|nr:hypothetical protein [Microcella daejeonensis]WAB81452.1 hypothetical protein OVN18_13115 [Microcella daejeonensis]WAB81466.1 hypothetical protein OVN18_00080 [Microcella daejeonensis]
MTEPHPSGSARSPRTTAEKARLYSLWIGVAFLLAGVALPFLTDNVATGIPFIVLGLVFVGDTQGRLRGRQRLAFRGGGDQFDSTDGGGGSTDGGGGGGN